jgi:hypothetical protein
MESRYGEVAVASTSGNEHQRSQLTGNSKVRRRSTRCIEHTRKSLLCIVRRITRNRACFDYPRADRHRSRHSGRLPAEHFV